MEKERWLQLDVFKFLGLASLLFWHTVIWWYTDGGTAIVIEEYSEKYYSFVQIGMSVFLFICISLPIGAGISLRYMLNSYFDLNSGKICKLSRKESFIFVLKRGLLLIILGTLINTISIGLDEFVSWDVLQMVGLVSILITLFLIFFDIKKLVIFGIFSLLMSKTISDYYYSVNYGVNDNSVIKLINNAIMGDPSGYSYYAFFPWASFVIFGFFIGNFIFLKKENKLKKWLLITGVALFPFYLLYRDIWEYSPQNTWGSHIFMPNTGDILGALSIFCIFFLILNNINFNCIKKYMQLGCINPINIFSRNILYIYVIHSIVIHEIVSLYVEKFRYNIWVASSTFIFQYLFAYFIGLLIHKVRLSRIKNVDI